MEARGRAGRRGRPAEAQGRAVLAAGCTRPGRLPRTASQGRGPRARCQGLTPEAGGVFRGGREEWDPRGQRRTPARAAPPRSRRTRGGAGAPAASRGGAFPPARFLRPRGRRSSRCRRWRRVWGSAWSDSRVGPVSVRFSVSAAWKGGSGEGEAPPAQGCAALAAPAKARPG